MKNKKFVLFLTLVSFIPVLNINATKLNKNMNNKTHIEENIKKRGESYAPALRTKIPSIKKSKSKTSRSKTSRNSTIERKSTTSTLKNHSRKPNYWDKKDTLMRVSKYINLESKPSEEDIQTKKIKIGTALPAKARKLKELIETERINNMKVVKINDSESSEKDEKISSKKVLKNKKSKKSVNKDKKISSKKMLKNKKSNKSINKDKKISSKKMLKNKKSNKSVNEDERITNMKVVKINKSVNTKKNDKKIYSTSKSISKYENLPNPLCPEDDDSDSEASWSKITEKFKLLRSKSRSKSKNRTLKDTLIRSNKNLNSNKKISKLEDKNEILKATYKNLIKKHKYTKKKYENIRSTIAEYEKLFGKKCKDRDDFICKTIKEENQNEYNKKTLEKYGHKYNDVTKSQFQKTIDETNKRILENQEEINLIRKEINKSLNEMDKIGKKAKKYQEKMNNLDAQLIDLKTQIKNNKEKIEKLKNQKTKYRKKRNKSMGK